MFEGSLKPVKIYSTFLQQTVMLYLEQWNVYTINQWKNHTITQSL